MEFGGFSEFFIADDFVLSQEVIEARYGADTAAYALSLTKPAFGFSDLVVNDEHFFLANADYTAILEIDNQTYPIKITGSSTGYPTEINNKICLWSKRQT